MDRFGEAAVRTHNHTLVYAAAQKIAQAWGVPRSAPKEMTTAMCLVTLPDHLSQNATPEKRKKVQTFLAESYKIACPCILHEDKLYMRLAANIHNKEEDYEQLAHAIMDKKLSRLLAHDL